MSDWFVYILECMDGSFYTGISNNVSNRMKVHASGCGSKYVKKKGFKQLLYSFKCNSRGEAARFEYEIKKLGKFAKLDWFRKRLN